MINWRLLLIGIVLFWALVILAYKGVEPFHAVAMIGYQAWERDRSAKVDTSEFPPPRTEFAQRMAKAAITGKLEIAPTRLVDKTTKGLKK